MKQLLIVAKDPVLPDAVTTALADLPCAMTCVDSAAAALEVLENRRVDLVFIDLRNLGQEGLGVLQALRASGNPVPVFVAPTHEEEMRSWRAAANRGVYYETMRTPVAESEIRAATTAAFSALS